MRNYSSLVTTITYDPVSWIDASYLDSDYSALSVHERRLVNEILFNTFAFLPISLDRLTSFEKEIIGFWPVLSRVFLLMACYRFKACVPSFLRQLSFDKDILEFLFALPADKTQSLPLKGETHLTLSPMSLRLQAFQEMASFLAHCSDPIRQRLLFLFPASMQRQTAQLGAVGKADFLLLRITCHYARSKYPTKSG